MRLSLVASYDLLDSRLTDSKSFLSWSDSHLIQVVISLLLNWSRIEPSEPFVEDQPTMKYAVFDYYTASNENGFV